MNGAYPRKHLAYVNRNLGPAPNRHNVLVLRGKLPTTPATYSGDAKMQSGVQMRYWDICQNTAFPVGRVGDCLYDEEIPSPRTATTTIVVSLPQDRPPNATAGCGAAWLNWGTVGDGIVRPTAGVLMIRNVFSSPSFTHAIQNVDMPGTEARVMGRYMPTGSYESPAQFAAARLPRDGPTAIPVAHGSR